MLKPDMSKFMRIENPMPQSGPVLHTEFNGKNPFLRCQIPQAIATNSDSLRQFYSVGVPQYRIVPPVPRSSG